MKIICVLLCQLLKESEHFPGMGGLILQNIMAFVFNYVQSKVCPEGAAWVEARRITWYFRTKRVAIVTVQKRSATV